MRLDQLLNTTEANVVQASYFMYRIKGISADLLATKVSDIPFESFEGLKFSILADSRSQVDDGYDIKTSKFHNGICSETGKRTVGVS